MTIWIVCDADGNALTDGLQGPEISDEARQTAQRIANSRGESVWLSPSDDSALAEEIEPTHQN